MRLFVSVYHMRGGTNYDFIGYPRLRWVLIFLSRRLYTVSFKVYYWGNMHFGKSLDHLSVNEKS